MRKIIVIYSGGMDSFTLLNDVLESYRMSMYEILALSFNYGQRHAKELEYAKRVTTDLGISHTIVNMVDIGNQLLQGSSQTEERIQVPEGHYTEESMKQTVVPNRNMIMLSLAVGYAISVNADIVMYGAHSGDHAIYPDCRSEFVEAMNKVTSIANWQSVRIFAPYMNFHKGQIASIGKRLHLDYGMAWTCYKGGDKACGRCGACHERLEAMAYAGIEDPLEYE